MVLSKNKWIFNFLWLILILILSIVILWPIYSNNIEFKFYFDNVLFIILSLIYVRYIFLMRYTFIENTIIPKFIVLPMGIISAIYSYYAMNEFIGFYQDNGMYFSLEKFILSKQEFLGHYIFRQFIFFGVLTLITSIILPFRIVVSIWRVYNKGVE